jgi:thiamine-phosphate pyrophosphorylase
MRCQLPKIYPITDTRLSGLSHAEQVEQLAAGGATLIQLRDKDASPREFFDQAVAAIRVARSKNIRVIINDRVDIALCSGADGVHLGQDDMPPTAARGVLGPNAIIGYSTHNVDQVMEAKDLPIDYLAIGPVFETSTKADPDPAIGLEGLRAMRELAGDVPVVAIGGINADNIGVVLAAGANSAAIIGCLYSEPTGIAERLRTLHGVLNKQ